LTPLKKGLAPAVALPAFNVRAYNVDHRAWKFFEIQAVQAWPSVR
jgi:hypothetical protein